jgi:hypothetical protein
MLIAAYLVLAFLVALCGRNRAIGFLGSLVGAVLITPPIMLVVLLLTRPRTTAEPTAN